MNLRDVFNLSKELINKNICYIKELDENRYEAFSESRRTHSNVTKYIFSFSPDNEPIIIEEKEFTE